MERNIYLLWLQGWSKAPWLQQKVLQSWRLNNPSWTINLIDNKNLKDYVNDIDYIYDKRKKISPQAKSDIIRLSLLKNHGGVWADSTLLCMQPLDHWVFEALNPSGIWMYHGHGAGLYSDIGPASWFIVSEKNSYLIKKWKQSCDNFWIEKNFAKDYFWMDGLFKELIEKDLTFKSKWLKTPFIYCESKGSSHTLADYNFTMNRNVKEIKSLIKEKPPYVIKLSSDFNKIFPNLDKLEFKNSNVNFAIKMSNRKYIFKHETERLISIPSPIKSRPLVLRILKKILRTLNFQFCKPKFFHN